ncbi:MAG: hypothetical protein ACKV1O_18585 [Saprospiraceae bacterium]
MDILFVPSRLKFPAKGAKDTPRSQSVMPSGFASFARPLRPLRETIAGKDVREVAGKDVREVFYIIQKSMFDSRSHVFLTIKQIFKMKKIFLFLAFCFLVNLVFAQGKEDNQNIEISNSTL